MDPSEIRPAGDNGQFIKTTDLEGISRAIERLPTALRPYTLFDLRNCKVGYYPILIPGVGKVFQISCKIIGCSRRYPSILVAKLGLLQGDSHVPSYATSLFEEQLYLQRFLTEQGLSDIRLIKRDGVIRRQSEIRHSLFQTSTFHLCKEA